MTPSLEELANFTGDYLSDGSDYSEQLSFGLQQADRVAKKLVLASTQMKEHPELAAFFLEMAETIAGRMVQYAEGEL
ncbi:MAG: hypothetical protein AAGE52_07730 [Myxococcota bacterium]